MQRRTGFVRHSMMAIAIMGMLASSMGAPLVSAAEPPDAVCPAQPGWLPYFNMYRSLANVPTVTEDTALAAGECNHSRYGVNTNTLTHAEDPGNAWFTTSGNYAGTHSNVAAASGSAYTYQQAIDGWMTGPFHEIGMIDPRLTKSEFAIYTDATVQFPNIDSAAAIDVLTNLGGPAPTGPVYFPANNTVMPLRQYGGGEFPDPLSGCGAGYTVPTGPPLALQLLTTPVVTASALSKDGVGALAMCEFDETNYTNADLGSQMLGQQVLGQRHAIILMPQAPLTDGTYHVSVTSNGMPYTWTFYVGTVPPLPAPRPTSPPSVGAPSPLPIAPRPSGTIGGSPNPLPTPR